MHCIMGKVMMFIFVLQMALTMTLVFAVDSPISSSSTDSPSNCSNVSNKTVIVKKVTDAIVKAVEKMFQESLYFRRRRASENTVPKTIVQFPNSKIHNEQIPLVDFVLPVELKRQHKKLRVVAISKEEEPGKGSDTTRFLRDFEGNSLRRQKRFCVPISYDDEVKETVEKVVKEAFETVKF